MIVIESVRLENIEFSANYMPSIEQRMLAEVEVQKLQQNAKREKVQAQISVTQATAKANAVRAEAQANADATRLNGEARAANIKITGEAEAAAIEARGKALGTNPNLVSLVQAERWNGVEWIRGAPVAQRPIPGARLGSKRWSTIVVRRPSADLRGQGTDRPGKRNERDLGPK
jgi:regulator of protease activity HflC (stomatin/prohibitin superfamily)